jgi:type I restriction enzyme S subunit
MSWREDIFDNFVRLKRGFDLAEANFEPGPFPVVASTSIMSYHKEYKVKGPGVITGRSGSLGSVQYVQENYWPHNTSLYVRDFKGNHPRYAFYFLQKMQLESFNSGAGVPTLNQNHLHKLRIRIPSLQIQKKIAAILTTYDELIENNQRRMMILERMAEEIYREWFVRFRFPGRENAEFSKGLPMEWVIDRIDSLGQVVTGKTPSTSISRYYGGPYLFIKTPDMHGNMFVLESAETLSQDGVNSQPSQTVPEGSICVSCIGTGGVVSITTGVCQTNQQINSVILTNESDLEWAFFTLRSLRETIQLFGSTGTTMTNLSKGKFSSLKILRPSNSLVIDFHKKARPIFLQLLRISKQTRVLSLSRDALLLRLVTERLPVETLNIQFPPSMLKELETLPPTAAHA